MTKRKIFDEMMEGAAAMKNHREGKITLRTYKIEAAPLPKVDSTLIRDTRKRLHCSRAVFARRLHINERTLAKWEQGRAKPNPQSCSPSPVGPHLSRHFRTPGTGCARLAINSGTRIRAQLPRKRPSLAPRNRPGGKHTTELFDRLTSWT
jgi:putative transcriptional regulator